MSSTTISPSRPAEPGAIDWGRYALVGLATIVAAVVANVAAGIEVGKPGVATVAPAELRDALAFAHHHHS